MHINLFLNSLFCRWEIQTHSSRRLSSGCCCLRRNQCRRGSRVCSDLCIWFTPTRTDIPEKPWLQRFLWRKYNFPHFEFCWREMFTLPKWGNTGLREREKGKWEIWKMSKLNPDFDLENFNYSFCVFNWNVVWLVETTKLIGIVDLWHWHGQEICNANWQIQNFQ